MVVELGEKLVQVGPGVAEWVSASSSLAAAEAVRVGLARTLFRIERNKVRFKPKQSL